MLPLQFLALSRTCRRLRIEPMSSLLREGLAPEVTPATCHHPSTMVSRYGNRHGRFVKCAMCGTRWRWDEGLLGWRSLQASSSSSLPLPTAANTYPAGAANKAKARPGRSTESPPIQSLPRSGVNRLRPEEFDLHSQMSQDLQDLEEDEWYDWDHPDL